MMQTVDDQDKFSVTSNAEFELGWNEIGDPGTQFRLYIFVTGS